MTVGIRQTLARSENTGNKQHIIRNLNLKTLYFFLSNCAGKINDTCFDRFSPPTEFLNNTHMEVNN